MTKYIEVALKGSEDVYYIQKLTVQDIRQVVAKSLALLSPLIGESIDTYQQAERAKISAYLTSDEASLDGDLGQEINLFSAFAIIGNQLENPLVEEVQDILLKGAKYSAQGKVPSDKIDALPSYSIKEAYDFKAYLKVLKVSFEHNAYSPFVECLNEVGYSEIVGNVQAVLKNKLRNPTS